MTRRKQGTSGVSAAEQAAYRAARKVEVAEEKLEKARSEHERALQRLDQSYGKAPAPPPEPPKKRGFLSRFARPNSSELPIVNPADYAFNENLFRMWAGAYGEARGYVWADHLESAFEEWVEWLDDHAPGHLMTVDEDDLKEAAQELGMRWQRGWPDYEDPDFAKVVEQAEVDLTVIGHTTLDHGTHIASWEWGADEVLPGSEEYRAVRERSEQEVEELE